jgi:hypothetical protein
MDFIQPYIWDKSTGMFKEHFGQARFITATSCIVPPLAMETWGRRPRYSWTVGKTRVQNVKRRPRPVGHGNSDRIRWPQLHIGQYVQCGQRTVAERRAVHDLCPTIPSPSSSGSPRSEPETTMH